MGAFDNLNPTFANRLQAMIAASGGLLAPGSGYRSVAEQTRLYNCKRSGGYNVPAVARPGKSKHNHGLAMDLVDTQTGRAVHPGSAAHNWLSANAGQFGFHRPVKGEAWHVELMDGVQGEMDASKYIGQDEDFVSYNLMHGTGDPTANPQDVLANRLHAVMRIIGGDPEEMQVGDESPGQEQGMTVGAGAEALDEMAAQGTGQVQQQPVGNAFAGGKISGSRDKAGLQNYAASLFSQFGWDSNELGPLIQLWDSESGWNPTAQNPTSTAFGIAQFLNGTWKGTGYQKTSDPFQQIQAGLKYIKGRYGRPSEAWNFKKRKNWY